MKKYVGHTMIRCTSIFQKKPLMVSVIIGILVGVTIFLLLGIPTDIIENQRYLRMIPFTPLDVFFLVSTAILMGVYAGLMTYLKITNKVTKISTKYGTSGTVFSFFAISCPTCIQFLVILFGTTSMMTYYNPVRPYIGVLSILLISYGIYRLIQVLRFKCITCVTK